MLKKTDTLNLKIKFDITKISSLDIIRALYRKEGISEVTESPI
jgi:hypothetical protein